MLGIAAGGAIAAMQDVKAGVDGATKLALQRKTVHPVIPAVYGHHPVVVGLPRGQI